MILGVTGPLWGESIDHLWISHTNVSDTQHFFNLHLNQSLNKQ